MVGESQGIFEKHGLDITAKEFTNGPLQIQALGSGDIDFGFIGPGALWLAMTGKAKVVAIQALGKADRVIAQPGISSMEDLKGKKVGVPEGTSGDMVLSMALEKAGMTADDIERVAMDPSTIVSAFTSGNIDAAGLWYPLIADIKKRVPDLEELAEDFPELSMTSCLVAGPKITENPELLKSYQAAVKDIMQWAVDNEDQLPKEAAKFLKAPEDSLSGELDYVDLLSPDQLIDAYDNGEVEEWMTNLNKQFVSFGKVDEVVDPSEYLLLKEFKEA